MSHYVPITRDDADKFAAAVARLATGKYPVAGFDMSPNAQKYWRIFEPKKVEYPGEYMLQLVSYIRDQKHIAAAFFNQEEWLNGYPDDLAETIAQVLVALTEEAENAST